MSKGGHYRGECLAHWHGRIRRCTQAGRMHSAVRRRCGHLFVSTDVRRLHCTCHAVSSGMVATDGDVCVYVCSCRCFLPHIAKSFKDILTFGSVVTTGKESAGGGCVADGWWCTLRHDRLDIYRWSCVSSSAMWCYRRNCVVVRSRLCRRVGGVNGFSVIFVRRIFWGGRATRT